MREVFKTGEVSILTFGKAIAILISQRDSTESTNTMLIVK